MRRRTFLLCAGAAVAAGCGSLPRTTGQHVVGRTSRLWADNTRGEEQTSAADDVRELPVQIWYPAKAGTGRATGYFPDLRKVSKGLTASGEVGSIEAFGLGFVGSRERLDAIPMDGPPRPVILLSPGNGTNVEFYDGIAGELASQGFVVVGINHPYDVAAVMLQNGSVAQFVEGPVDRARPQWVAQRVRIRTADMLAVLARLGEANRSDPLLKDQLDLQRVGAMGHSLGGITAVQAAYASPVIRACLNVDGLQRGGPFAVEPADARPAQPFMFVTKEERLGPAATALLQSGSSPAYLVTTPGAQHGDFSDGGSLALGGRGSRVVVLMRTYTLAFFRQTLLGQPDPLLAAPSKSEQVHLEVFGA